MWPPPEKQKTAVCDASKTAVYEIPKDLEQWSKINIKLVLKSRTIAFGLVAA
tara:strand:- start:6009 stop:6164 length:156 start_codon:yes stop_codon:yes gene_type:complete